MRFIGLKKVGYFLLFLSLLSTSYAQEKIFYVLRTTTPLILESLENNYREIDILISQAYKVDSRGKVSGFINPQVLNFAGQHAIKLMAMITNTGYDPKKAHIFLTHPRAQERAIHSLLTACLTQHLYGVQFDYEMVNMKDRHALTHFYQMAAAAFHKHGLIISYAVAPLVEDNPQGSAFLKRQYTHWEGTYDFKELGQSADFLTIMTYDQHNEGTTPGATATYPWVEQAIQYALRHVPAQKISLGIPTYSSFWYTGTNPDSNSQKISVQLANIGYDKVVYLLQKNQAHLIWDDTAKVNYAFYNRHELNEYLFVEDAKSLQPKLDLAKKYQLRGISIFRLGLEDPKIWDTLGNK